MENRALYLECYSGISGDMTIGMLLDMGASFDNLKEQLGKLNLKGYELTVGRIQKNGIDCCDFDVILEEEHGHEHHHEHHQENHDHGHGHHHHDHHNHHSGHHHDHRKYSDIHRMIEESDLNSSVKKRAISIFQVLAEAEAKVHGKTVEDVAFHEVGAVDSIVDIVGCAICMEELGIAKVIISRMYEGCGHVWCQHGKVPVPAPAVMELVVRYNLPIHITEVEGELITPTGAAIVAAMFDRNAKLEDYKMTQVGIGAGNKDFPHANILRGILLESRIVVTEDRESVWVLESNIDDSTGENLGYVISQLMGAGALDAVCFPCMMKKERYGWMLQVICREEDIPQMEEYIFTQTTAIGLRKYQEIRTVLPRKIEIKNTVYGPVRYKICSHHGSIFAYPEYEDIQKICEKTKKSYGDIYHELTGKEQ